MPSYLPPPFRPPHSPTLPPPLPSPYFSPLQPALLRMYLYQHMALQELAQLLYQLKSGGHKALIFTQMTKMLDVLEAFLNLHGYTYLRLDGTTKPEQRQASPRFPFAHASPLVYDLCALYALCPI